MNFEAMIRGYIERSPRFAPYRKTIAGAVTTLGAFLLFLISLPTGILPTNVMAGVAIASGIVTGLAYFVPNDLTPKQVTDLEVYGRHAKRD